MEFKRGIILSVATPCESTDIDKFLFEYYGISPGKIVNSIVQEVD